MPNAIVIHADSLEHMRTMPTESIDAIVTDPPYGLSEHRSEDVAACLAAWIAGEVYAPRGRGFMGRAWDAWVPGPEVWREVLRVLKPGGHALIFAGSRTQDLIGMAVRLAGFEMRDTLQWLYGSGFPKSLDVSKAIDKEAGAERADLGPHPNWREGKRTNGQSMGAVPNEARVTAPATDAARQWSGWGTALKPAYEPIILARKPLRGTVARNVQTFGTGAVNVDGCRVAAAVADDYGRSPNRADGTRSTGRGASFGAGLGAASGAADASARWPANVLLDEAAAEVLDQMAPPAGASAPVRGDEASVASTGRVTGERKRVAGVFHGDRGGASRFFYVAKASKAERESGLGGEDGERANVHPTVKPVALMRWLVRLVTPHGGLILDPFTGSGTTGVACMAEGFRFIGIEREAEYVAIARARIEHATPRQPKVALPEQIDLFDAEVGNA